MWVCCLKISSYEIVAFFIGQINFAKLDQQQYVLLHTISRHMLLFCNAIDELEEVTVVEYCSNIYDAICN